MKIGVKERIFNELKVTTSVAKMSEPERMRREIDYIKDNMTEGVFRANEHRIFASLAKYHGVYEGALKSAGAVFPKEAWRPIQLKIVREG